MADQPPRLCTYDSDEESFFALSCRRSPITSHYNPFSFQDEDLDCDIGDAKLLESENAVIEAMGGDLPFYPDGTTSGRFEDDLQSQPRYEYDENLSWQQGLEIIDEFDWGQPAPEGPQKHDEGVVEARPATSVVEASQSSNSASQVAPHSIPLSVDHMEIEPSADVEVSYSKTGIPAPTFESSFSLPHRSELSQPPATPPAPWKSSEHRQESSSPWIKSPPLEASIGPGIVVPPTPSQAAESSNATGLLSRSSAPLGHAAEPNSMSPDSIVVDEILNAEGIQEAIEGCQEPLAKLVAKETERTPRSHKSEQAVTPNTTEMDLQDDDREDDARFKADGELLKEAQTHSSPDAAEEIESTDWDSLFDGDDAEDALQDQKPDDPHIDVVFPVPETEERSETLNQDLLLRARSIADQSSERVADDAPMRASSPSEDDIAAQILAQFNMEDQESTLATSLEKHVGDVSSAAEALLLLSNGAKDMTEPDQERPAEDTLVEATETHKQHCKAGVGVESSSGPASQAVSPVLLSHDQPPTGNTVTNEQSPQSNDMMQGIPSKIKLNEDTLNVHEAGATAEAEMVAAPSEETAIATSSHVETQQMPFTLKIGKFFWNSGSLGSHNSAEDDTNAVGDIPTATTSTPGVGEDEPQEEQDALPRYEAESPVGSHDNSHEPAESSDAPCLLVDASHGVPASPGEEGAPSDSEEGAPSDREEATPQPLLPGLEEHAAAAASSSTIAPSSPSIEPRDRSSLRPAALLEELELPPSPYETEPDTGGLSTEAQHPGVAPSETAKASLKGSPVAEPMRAQLPVPKQDTPFDAPKFCLPSLKFSGTLPSPVPSPALDLEAPFQSDSEAKPADVVPQKRGHTATVKRTKAISVPTAGYKEEGDSGSEDEAPPKKRSKKQGGTLLSLQEPDMVSRSKGNTELVASSKGPRGKKAARLAVEEEIVDKEDTEVKEPEQVPREKEEKPADAASNAATGTTKSASRTKGNSKAKKAVPAKPPAAPKPTSTRAPPRSTRSKPAAALSNSSTPDAGSQRRKYGFKPPTSRKRQSTDADAESTPSAPVGRKRKSTNAITDADAHAGAVDEPAPLQRQTRMASAAQEERERQAEIEGNVARRTRGARKSAG
ncbi:hypothetical protein PMIN04_005932 [Paraphaeosphaeria minitans]